MNKKVNTNNEVVVKEENRINWKDILVRSIKTFIQSTISYLIMSVNGMNFFNETSMSQKVMHGLILGAISAGVCAVWNSVLSPLLDVDGTPTVKVIYVDRPVTVEVPTSEINNEDEFDGINNG